MTALIPVTTMPTPREVELASSVTALAQPVIYPADRNPALVYLASLASGSRRTMQEALDVIARLLNPSLDHRSAPWAAMRYQHTQAVRSWLAENYSESTANKMLSALRGTLKEAWRLGHMSAEDYQRAVDLKNFKVNRVDHAEKGRHVTSGELIALVNACNDGTKAGLRDAAILAVAYTGGLRRAELAALRLEDYRQDDSQITVKSGKGGKDRTVYLPESACEVLDQWVDQRGPWAGALFTQIRRGDHVTVDGLSEQSIYIILTDRAEQAGVKEFSPHDMRRTYAGDLLDAGVDLSTVQKLMGHASPTTTAAYDRRGQRAKKQAGSKLHFPRVGR